MKGIATIILAALALAAVAAFDLAMRRNGHAADSSRYLDIADRAEQAATSVRRRTVERPPLPDLSGAMAHVALPEPEPIVAPEPVEPLEPEVDPEPVEVLPPPEPPPLGAIFWSTIRPLAQLGGHVAGIGDEVDGFTIVGIEKESVTLRDADGREYHVALYEERQQ